jgi:hypothetical protein
LNVKTLIEVFANTSPGNNILIYCLHSH